MKNKELKNKVFEALGEVSMCWSETPNGIFDSEKAKEIGERLLKDIAEEWGNSELVNIKSIPDNFNAEEYIGLVKNQGFQFVQTEPTLEEAIKVLQKHFREDKSEGSYYHSWMCNIEMCVYDAMKDNGNIKEFNQDIILNMCKEGAKNFLDLLIKE